MFFNLLLYSVLVFAEPADLQACKKDSDCVPNSSCHPTKGINKKYRKEDKGIMCSMDCRTPLDCGRAKIVCEKNKCTVISLVES